MTNEFARSPLAKAGLRLVAATVLVGGLAACSTMESLDPTGFLGGDSTGGTSDTGGLSQTDAPSSEAPDVAEIPDRPKPIAGAEENANVTSSLQADAANVQYSAESLRGGTEAAANGPQAPSATAPEVAALPAPAPAAVEQPAAPAEASPPTAASEPASQPRTAEDYAAEAPGQPAAAAPPPDMPESSAVAEAPAQPEPAASPDAPTQVATAPLTEAPPQPAPAPPPPEPSAADVATAIPEPAPAPEPVPETPAPTAAAVAEAPMPEAKVAEAPSQPAPAPSPDAVPAAEPVPQPVQVANAGPVPGAQAPVTRRAAPGFAPSNAPPLDPTVSQFVAAPVVARYRQTAALQPSVYPDSTPTPGYYGPATATVHFPENTTILDERGRQQVRAAAELFKSYGGRGFVRVVGYASSASGNLAPNRLIQVNFEQSRARATTIARALMKEGVPANKVLVDSAAQTSANAKAEIFVQG